MLGARVTREGELVRPFEEGGAAFHGYGGGGGTTLCTKISYPRSRKLLRFDGRCLRTFQKTTLPSRFSN